MKKITLLLALIFVFSFANGSEEKAPAEKGAVKEAAAGITAEQGIKKLKEGNKRFAAGKAIHPNQTSKRRTEIAKAQHPFAIVVTCSDSRVPPELLFDQGQGDLFIIRSAGNVVDDIGMGSIEYAAEHLNVPLVVVLGHKRCGAVDATVKGGEIPGHIAKIAEIIQPAVDKAKGESGDVLTNSIKINAEMVADKIKESEPIMNEMVKERKVKVVSAYYDLDTGVVEFEEGGNPQSKASIEKLLEGNKRYTSGKSIYPDQSVDKRKEVAAAQHPFAVIVSCSDSRVPPEVVFDQGLGDIFIVRSAGNVVDDIALGSIEYAVEHLHAPLVMVLGHERCGAVDATVKGGEIPGHIAKIADMIQPAVDANKGGKGDIVDNSVRTNVRMIAAKLEKTEPFLSEMVKEKKIEIVGAYYDLDTGAVSIVE